MARLKRCSIGQPNWFIAVMLASGLQKVEEEFISFHFALADARWEGRVTTVMAYRTCADRAPSYYWSKKDQEYFKPLRLLR